jgi:homoserine dehydrogenase
MVSPFILKNDSALSGVSGVYNAVEVVGEPIGNVMFYGKGAGAGATASAVVGDLMQTMNYAGLALPKFEKCDSAKDFALFSAKRYLAFDKEAEKAVRKVFHNALYLETDECSLITEEITEAELAKLVAKIAKEGFDPLSSIRIL